MLFLVCNFLDLAGVCLAETDELFFARPRLGLQHGGGDVFAEILLVG